VDINIVKWTNILEWVEKDAEMERAFLKFYNIIKVVE